MKKTIPVLLGLSLGLVGCGGGDDGGDSATAGGVTVNYDGPTAAVEISDATIAQQAGDAAAVAMLQIDPSQDTVSAFYSKAGSASTIPAPSLQLIIDEAVDGLYDTDSQAMTLAGAVTTTGCEGGGTMTRDAVLHSPLALNDYERVTYSDCTISPDWPINFKGTSFTKVTAAQGIPRDPEYFPTDTWTLGIYTDTALAVTANNVYFAVDGDMAVQVSNAAYVMTNVMTGSSLALEFQDETTHFVQLMSDFRLEGSVDRSSSLYNPTYSAKHDFTVANSEMGGSVTVVTNDTFVLDPFQGDFEHPYTGSATVTDGTNSVTLTVGQNTELLWGVHFQYDQNSDGTIESEWFKTWAELEP